MKRLLSTTRPVPAGRSAQLPCAELTPLVYLVPRCFPWPAPRSSATRLTQLRPVPRPLPAPQLRHTSRFIICYLTFLPFALWTYLEWLLLPTMVVLTFLLLGIENIGIQVGARSTQGPPCMRHKLPCSAQTWLPSACRHGTP